MLLLLGVVGLGGALLLLPAADDGLLGLPELRPGDQAPRTVKSPQAFVIADPETTDRLRKEAVEAVRPTYDLFVWLGGHTKERIEAAFAAASPSWDDASERKDADVARERARSLMLALVELGVALDEDALLPFMRASAEDELRDAAIMIAQEVYENRIVDDKALLRLRAPHGLEVRLLHEDGSVVREEPLGPGERVMGIDEARAKVDELVAEKLGRLPVDARRAVALLVKKLLRPNLAANSGETERRKRAAEAAVKTVVRVLSPGETVLRAGERVTEQHLFLVGGIGQELRAQSRVQAAAGGAILIVLLVILAYRYAKRSYREDRPSHRDLAFLASSYLFMLLLLWSGYKAVLYLHEEYPVVSASGYRHAIPVAVGALVVRLVAGMEAAAAFTAVIGFTAGWMMDASLGFAAYSAAGCLAAASVRDGHAPAALVLRAGLRAGLAQAGIVVALALLASNISLETTAPEIVASLCSGLASALLAWMVVPLVEGLFGYTTALKLHDLANLNHPLLRELLVEAPGTYHHSIMVGTLAEAAAGSIGASTLLARVGGYYHDIGKTKNPHAFDENGQRGFSGISTAEAAKVRRMHVTEGLELAARHRLGQPVLEVIAQHHGRSVVRASTRPRGFGLATDEGEALRYPGPKPLSREAGLVMLADVVEAQTRHIDVEVDLSRPELVRMVREMVAAVLEDRQLDDCPLTMREIDLAVESFARVLEDRLLRRPRVTTLPGLPQVVPVVRPPLGGEPN